MTAVPAQSCNPAFGLRALQGYAMLGLPLAFAALPLYVILPHHYAREFGLPLAALGAVLLGARLADAVLDPLLGRWADRLLARSPRAVLGVSALAAVCLALGLALLFFPIDAVLPDAGALLAWATAMLMLTYLGYSFLSIAHQAWGALQGGSEAERSRLTGSREVWGLVGVLTASVLPTALGLPLALAVFAVLLALGWLMWSRSVAPPPPAQRAWSGSLWSPWRESEFQRLLGVFMLNGVASAVPATLVLFFVQDRLQAPAHMEPLFLGSYFLCAALSMPLWLALVRRLGLARSWLAGMLLAVTVFVGTPFLAAGDAALFVAVCMLSGLALGADLALPSALLAGVIQRQSDGAARAGAYFGWWNFATKLNLALAAGLALPLLQLLGYAPGARDAQALTALSLAYGLVPCGLKLLAALALYAWIVRPSGAALKVSVS